MSVLPLVAMPDLPTDPDVLADRTALRAIPIHERPKPRMRGRLHQGRSRIDPGGTDAVLLAPEARARIATLIYAVTLTGLFGVSASYHLGLGAAGARPHAAS